MTRPVVLPAVAALRKEVVTLRCHVYAHPELGFEERRTAVLVTECLEVWGYRVSRGVSHADMVGILYRGEGPALGLHANMDALPIQGATGLPYASQVGDVIHAYGHDGHTTMLLVMARHLIESPCWRNTLQPIFQLVEEDLDGTRAMLGDGLLERFPCDAIFAMHDVPGYPIGHLGLHLSPFMASVDTVIIRVIGSGGHDAVPQHTAGPVVVYSTIVLVLQSIVSRNVDPQDTAIVSVGTTHAGAISNVIPTSAEMIFNVRTLTAGIRALLECRISKLTHGQVASFGAQAEVDYWHCYPVLVNHPGQTAFAREVACDWLGEECLIDGLRSLTASEGFALIPKHCPSNYLVIGNGRSESDCQLHNSNYDFNSDCLATGTNYWVQLAERFLT